MYWDTDNLDCEERELLVCANLFPKGISEDELRSIHGYCHYGERLLFHLLLSSCMKPKFKIIMATSSSVSDEVVDYYLGLLRTGDDITENQKEWKSRIKMISPTKEFSGTSLSDAMLNSPEFLSRIQQLVRSEFKSNNGMFVCLMGSGSEHLVAEKLGLKLIGPQDHHLVWGSKEGSRRLFEECQVPHPRGTGLCHNSEELAEKITELWKEIRSFAKGRDPNWINLMPRKLVVKLNDLFCGKGNAMLDLARLLELESSISEGTNDPDQRIKEIVKQQFDKMEFQESDITWQSFQEEMTTMGAIAEVFLESENKDGESVRSPSVQVFIGHDGSVNILATHEQDLDGQSYTGCRFPAGEEYRLQLHKYGQLVGSALSRHGYNGHFSVDFYARLNRPSELKYMIESHPLSNWPASATGGWCIHALEINLRNGGTTHPMMLMKLLTGGHYDQKTGLFMFKDQARYYSSSDYAINEDFIGLRPADIKTMFTNNPLAYNQSTGKGVIFHMLGPLFEHGKLGLTSIGSTEDEAQQLFDDALAFIRTNRNRFLQAKNNTSQHSLSDKAL